MTITELVTHLERIKAAHGDQLIYWAQPPDKPKAWESLQWRLETIAVGHRELSGEPVSIEAIIIFPLEETA